VVGEVVAGAGLVRVDAPPTFPAHLPRRRIDWIAVDGLAVEGVEVPALDASDHRPLVATCVLA
jgi:endonuclease/exonuclease/phosphatase family metal-dependent hydrolase